MSEKKKWCQNKKKAETEAVIGMYLLLMLAVLLCALIQTEVLRISSAWAEDALTASNLASAVIDIEEYGRTRTIVIRSPEEAYARYRDALRCNMNLNEMWESENKYLAGGPVEVQEYIVYNVRKEDVEIISFGPEGSREQTVPGGVGKIQTPDGTVVETTAVYSKIAYPVSGILGLQVMAVKQETVDIISNGRRDVD